MLSAKEIENIKALLLSPDNSNLVLATTLLQEQPTAVQTLLIPLEIALTYSEQKEAVIQLLQSSPLAIAWQKLPLYAFYTTIAEPQIQPEHHTTIYRFIRQESLYRPYLLEDPNKTILYVDSATFISAAPEFVPTAHRFYTLALAHLPESSYLYYNYADLLRQHPPKGKTLANVKSKIIYYYNKAYTIKKEQHIISRLANFYAHDLKDVAAARETWQWCLKEHPNYGTAWITLAKLEVEQKQWVTAQQLLEKALALQAKGVWVELDQLYYLLGTISWQGEKDSYKASQYFEQSLNENKYYAAPLEALMRLSLDTKNYQQAIHWHRIALDLQPLNIFLLLKLAKLYLKTENYDRAATTYQEILEISPTYSPAMEGLRKLEHLQKP